MYFLYSILYSAAFLLIAPLLLLGRRKYAEGFRQRLGNYPDFRKDGRPVIWLHCVSVGETNAARPLVNALAKEFPHHRLVVSTTTRTGQDLARKVLAQKADAIFYFPFDWKFSVRRALSNFDPTLVLLMETEMWPQFIHEARLAGAKIAIVNGRLSESSFRRYSRVRSLIASVLGDVDVALMQAKPDADRIRKLGLSPDKVLVTGNLKFEQGAAGGDELTEYFRSRYGIGSKPLIVAASTHEPEERYVLEALEGELGNSCRLMIAPRHPERFDAVARLLTSSACSATRRSEPESEKDRAADVILLDSIGELRSVYPLADIVFVGGSLIPHGGQNVIEPAAEGKPIVTGPYTANFESVVREFVENDAIRQIPAAPDEAQITKLLYEEFAALLGNEEKRLELGRNAAAVVGISDRNAVDTTVESLRPLLAESS
jgi:3-deoxy-D-manno-octulosonic-acid transferase